MRTDVVEPVAHRLTAAGEDLDGRWQAGRARIEAGEAAIGNDVLAAAFRGIYDSDRDLIRGIADETPGVMRGDGTVAVDCIGLYLDADGRAAAGLADRVADGA